MPRTKCAPCLEPGAKDLILKSLPAGKARDLVQGLPTCGESKKRPRSVYQEHISACMKAKNIKGFGEAPGAMRECAAAWRQKKGT